MRTTCTIPLETQKGNSSRRFFLAGNAIGKEEGHVPSVSSGKYVTSPPEFLLCFPLSDLLGANTSPWLLLLLATTTTPYLQVYESGASGCVRRGGTRPTGVCRRGRGERRRVGLKCARNLTPDTLRSGVYGFGRSENTYPQRDVTRGGRI